MLLHLHNERAVEVPGGQGRSRRGVVERVEREQAPRADRDDFAPLKKLHTSSPSDYEFKVKHLYGRLRDSYERLVEEHIFCDVVRRGVDRIETQKLRMVSDALAIRSTMV